MPTALFDPELQAVLDAVAGLVVIVDPEGRVLGCNEACEQLSGYGRDEVCGRWIWDTPLAPGEPAVGRARLACLAAGHGPPLAFESQWLTRAGERRHIAWNAKAVRDPEGRLRYVVGTGVDLTEARQIEQALRESNDRFQALFDATSDAVVMHEGGVVIEVNRSCCEMFGYAADELVGHNGMELVFPPESRERVRRLLAAGHDGVYEAVMRRKDGSTLLAEVRGRTIDYKGRRVRVASNRDVTEQRRAEQALREGERRLRLAVEHSPDLMFQQDADLRYTWFSRTAPPVRQEDVVGATEADLVRAGMVEPDDERRLVEAKRRVLRTGVGERVETRHPIGGVTRYYETAIERRLDDDGRVAGLAGYARDVTERTEAERALRGANEELERRVAARTAELEARTRELEARSAELARSELELREQGRLLRLIVENMGDGVAVADPDGRFLLFNPAAERTIGTRPADVTLEQWPAHFGFFLPDARTPYPARELPLRRALRGEPTDDAEIFVRHPARPGGSWISVTARPLRDELGGLAGGVTVIRDLTERKAAERALRESEQHHRELAEHNRWLMRELEHRVGNNLSSLLALVSMTRSRTSDVGAFADAIESRLQAMSSVHRLLAGAGGAAVGLATVVRAALHAMRNLASAEVAETLEGPDVRVPRAQVLPLMLILVEWYTNSCKYGVHSPAAAAEGQAGRLGVTWEWAAADGNDAGEVRLRWVERGGPVVRGPTTPSLGSELVAEFAGRELGGRSVMRLPPEGADHALEFPLRPPVSPDTPDPDEQNRLESSGSGAAGHAHTGSSPG